MNRILTWFAGSMALLASMVAIASSSTSVSLAEIKGSELAKSDRLRQKTDAIGSRMRDEVISTGTFHMEAMELKSARRLSPVAVAQFNTELIPRIARSLYLEIPGNMQFETVRTTFESKWVSYAAKIAADEVNAYNPRSGARAQLERRFWVVLNELGLKQDPGFVVISRGAYNDENDDLRYVTQLLFVNTKSRRAVLMFMRQGSM